MGAETSDVLIVLKAWSNSSDYTNSFFVLKSGRSGDNRSDMLDVDDDSWLTTPMKERRSVRLVGVGKLSIACVIDGSIRYPADERWKPAKLTVDCANFHLERLRVMRFSAHR